ncbi:MAG: hypothetical protein IJV24_02240 [Prevotella sp.]|nr:hypothetical protein [Prevotella sp.]
MRQLNKWQSAVFVAGAFLMVIGAASNLLKWGLAPYVFAVGALGFASMQMLQSYEGSNFVVRRLRRIMLLSDVLFMVSAALMFAGNGNPLHLDWMTYLQYVHQKWVATLLLAAILQLYVTHRISHELEREAKKR